MNMTSLRRAIIAVAVLATAAFPVLAQTPPGPPVCGSVASLMNLQIYLDASGPLGDNIVSVPAVSPVNLNPNSANNGFKQLCDRFLLTGTTTNVIQMNAQAGTVTSFVCNQASPPTWTVGQAALVRPSASATGRIPGIECSRPYTSYGEGSGAAGDNMYPVPATIASSSPQDLCSNLSLPAGSQVIQFLAGAGTVNTHLCGATPTWALRLGEGVLIRPTGAPGAAVATGSPVIF